MKKAIFTLLIFTVASCSSLNNNTPKQAAPSVSTPTVTSQHNLAERPVAAPDSFQPARFAASLTPSNPIKNESTITIQHYVRGLMQEMFGSMHSVFEQAPVAVASFVYLDTDYNQGTLLGNQIAESVMHELHRFGAKVVDYKVTDYIRITPEGDFAYSRDYKELNDSVTVQYALGGTLTRHNDGVLVNARMVEFNSKNVVASAQTLIPNAIVNALHSSTSGGMTVIKGAK